MSKNTTGFIFTEVEHDYSWEAQLKIGDCSRIVSLDVYINDEKDRKKSLKKIDLIISELTKFKSAIEGIKYGI